jgi:putative tryptophan/tyrosine transport system substrate-binding protein
VKRREFITLLGGAAVAWPLAARAQQAAVPVIGFLSPTAPAGFAERLRMFRQGLSEAAYVEGHNVAIEYRWANDDSDRLPALAADLVRAQPAVIVTAGGSGTAAAAKAATRTIPIVFLIGADPVKLGLTASLNRPGGNATGVTLITVETVQKRLEILRELVPNADAFALLVHNKNPNLETYARDVQAAARALGRRIDIYKIASGGELDDAFATLVQRSTGGVVVSADPIFTTRPDDVVAAAARHAVPTLYPFREFVTAGGLISYGPKFNDAMRQVGSYAGRILKGQKSADLPVQQFTDVDLIINLRTAKALGLTAPPTLLARANEVIE